MLRETAYIFSSCTSGSLHLKVSGGTDQEMGEERSEEEQFASDD